MNDLGELIKELALKAVEAEKPVEVVTGIITSKKPLIVNLEQKLRLSQDFIMVLKGANFEVGDRVALIRCGGGQKYLLIDAIL